MEHVHQVTARTATDSQQHKNIYHVSGGGEPSYELAVALSAHTAESRCQTTKLQLGPWWDLAL